MADRLALPFVDVTRTVKQFLVVRVTLVCDSYLYETRLKFPQLEKLLKSLVEVHKRSQKMLMPKWLKKLLSSKYYIVDVQSFEHIEIQKVMLDSVQLQSSEFISHLVIF